MIRRWSYLNSLNYIFSSKYKTLNFVYYEQSFKINIFFKKNINSISTLSRKSWSRRKHLHNWIIYQNIFSDWSSDYLFFKQFNNLVFNYQLFKNSFVCYNTLIMKRLNPLTSVGMEKFTYSSLTKKIISYNLNLPMFTNFYQFLGNYRNVSWFYVTTCNNVDDFKTLNSNQIHPIFLNAQGNFSFVDRTNTSFHWFISIWSSLFTLSLYNTLELYRINTLLLLPLLKTTN
jgi:hypothetical protein